MKATRGKHALDGSPKQSSNQRRRIDDGNDPNPNESEIPSPTDEFDGATLIQILKERSISQEIIDKCNKENISSVAHLRKLKYSVMVKHFKTDKNICFIDWKHIEGLWSGDVLPVDYIPPIRKQCKENRVNLEYAEMLEEMGVSDLNEVDEATLRDLREKLIERKKQKDGTNEDDMEDNHGDIDQCIEDVRAAVGKVKDTRSTIVGEEDPGEEPSEEPSNEEMIEELLAAREATLTEASNMRASIQEAMSSLDPKELQGMLATQLEEKLNSVKEQVQAPSEMDDVGKNFEGFDGLMAKTNTDAIFTLYPEYIPPYTDDKDLIAAASGGIALNGIGVFSEMGTPFISSTMPVLAPPRRVTTLGTFSAFESKILKTTMESEAASFQSTACSFGMSMAESIQSERSVGASFQGRFVGSETSVGRGRRSEESRAVQNESNSSSFNNTKTQSAQITEYIMMPMRAFRIPRTEFKLSDEAILELRKVTNETTARAFFSKFGTHVSRARHTLGGVFFRKISLTSDQVLSANKMFCSAGEQLEKSKASSSETDANVGVRTPGVRRRGGGRSGRSASSSVSASRSKGHSSSMGKVEVSSNDNTDAKASCTYTFDTRCMGPNASSPEEFAHVLQANNATWACMDRGDPTSLMPIWEIVETTYRDISETAKNLITGSSSMSVESGEEMTEKMTNNKKLACLLKRTWLGMLPPRLQTLWKINPSIKHLLREGNQYNTKLYEDLAALILDYVGPITYNDDESLYTLKCAVAEATAIMSQWPSDLPASKWLENYLGLGKGKLETEDQTRLTSMLANVADGVHQDAAALAAKFSTNDWSSFNRFFQQMAMAHFNLQQHQAKAFIQQFENVKFKIVLAQNAKLMWGIGTTKCGEIDDDTDEGKGGFPIQFSENNDPSRRIFTFERKKDNDEKKAEFFKLIPTCSTGKRVDFRTNQVKFGPEIQITNVKGNHVNQEWVLYKPLSISWAPNTFIILSKQNTQTCIASPDDKCGTKLLPTNWQGSTNNVFTFVQQRL